MSQVTESVSIQMGGSRPFTRLTALILLFIAIGYMLATHGLTQTLVFVFALSALMAFLAARYPWLAVVSPMIIFTVLGIGISSGVSFAGASINLADVLLLPALAPSVVKVLAGRRDLPYPSIPAMMMAAWIILGTSVGIIIGNPFSIIRNELHVLLFIILAYYWAIVEIRSSRYLRYAIIAMIAATAVAGIKAGCISFFVGHFQEGYSDAWQAMTMISEQLGGQRTILNGADTMFVLAIPMIAAFSLFFSDRRSYFYLFAAFACTLAGLMISLTRTNWATVLVAILILLVIGARSSGRQVVRIASGIFLISILAIFISQFFTLGSSTYDFGEILQRRLEPNPYTGTGNLNYRIRESEALIEQGQKHAILGNGLGARFAFIEFRGASSVNWAHNGHLWIFLKTGYIGMALFYTSIITVVWQLLRAAVKRYSPLISAAGLGAGVALIALMLMSLLVNRISNVEGAYFIGLAFALPQIFKFIIAGEHLSGETGDTRVAT